MLKLLSFVGPVIRVATGAMSNVANWSDKNQKKAATIAAVGFAGWQQPQWLAPIGDFLIGVSNVIASVGNWTLAL
jgi:uncharacterized protein CbrC (UPF0167 family)